MNDRLISLAHLTLFDVPPPQLVTVAEAAGFAHVGIRVTPSRQGPAYPMHPGSPMLRETLRRLADSDVSVFDVEVIRLDIDTEPLACEPFLQTAGELGGRHIIVASTDPDRSRATERFAGLCDLAAPYGLGCVLEFMVFSAVPTLVDALAMVTSAGRPNGGVLVDALHLARSGGSLDQVAAAPPHLLPYAQLCDARDDAPATDIPAAEDEARRWRLVTGEGALPLAGLLQALPAGAPVSLEIPDGWSNPEPLARAQTVLRAAEKLLASIDDITESVNPAGRPSP
jgi:sugar phosphate isomerase/epimerase